MNVLAIKKLDTRDILQLPGLRFHLPDVLQSGEVSLVELGLRVSLIYQLVFRVDVKNRKVPPDLPFSDIRTEKNILLAGARKKMVSGPRRLLFDCSLKAIFGDYYFLGFLVVFVTGLVFGFGILKSPPAPIPVSFLHFQQWRSIMH